MPDGVESLKVTPRKGIAVAIANDGRGVPLEWSLNMMTMNYPVNTNVNYLVAVGGRVDAAREALAEDAIRKGCKYLWFIDDDTAPPIDAARKLMAALDEEEMKGSKVKVVGGIYCVKNNTPSPLVFQGPGAGPDWNWKVGDIFPVWGIGTGCMMINTDVFQHLEKPWFSTVNEIGMTYTDDLYFCERLRIAGFGIKAHGGVLCRHHDLVNQKVYSLPAGSFPYQPRGES